jgi:Peptidase family M28
MNSLPRKSLVCYASLLIVLNGAFLGPLNSSSTTVAERNLIEYEPTNRGIDILSLINEVNKTILDSYVKELISFGSRPAGSKACEQAGAYIASKFSSFGLDVSVDNWSFFPVRSQNIVATLHGSNTSSDAEYLLSAHYDTRRRSIGANDDASGIATILTIAQICSQYHFNHTIRFVALSGEECGLCTDMPGSRDYARKAYSRGDNIVACFDLDVIGSCETQFGSRAVRVYTPIRASWIPLMMQQVCDQYPTLNMTIEQMSNHPADQQAFISWGYDAVLICQADEIPDINNDDVYEHLNLSYIMKVCRLMIAVTGVLAQRQITLQVRFTAPLRGYMYAFGQKIKAPGLARSFLREGVTYLIGRTMARINITSTEPIKQVAYGIDDLFIMRFNDTQDTEWKIQGYDTPLIGRHSIMVYVSTESGNIARDQMDVYCLTLSHMYFPWLAPFFYYFFTP